MSKPIRQLQLALALLTVLIPPLPAVAQHEAVAEQEIQYLLAFVASSDCTFIRNGTAHSAADAADHLRLKYDSGKRYVDTPEQFIDRLASKSSWSGQPYSVECNDLSEPAGQWLHEALAAHRNVAGHP